MRAEKKKLILEHILAGVLIGGVLSLYHIIFGSSCIIKGLTGIDCPFCGMTRAFVAAFVHFDLKAAFSAHPLFPIAVPFLLLCFHTGRLKRRFGKKIDVAVWAGIVLFLLVFILRLVL